MKRQTATPDGIQEQIILLFQLRETFFLKIIKNLSKILVKENIDVYNMASNKIKLNNIIASYLKVNKISDNEKSIIIEGIIQTLI